MLVTGIYTFRFGRLTTISPGRRPSGSFTSQGQSRPAAMSTMPMITRVLCIVYGEIKQKQGRSGGKGGGKPFSAALPVN